MRTLSVIFSWTGALVIALAVILYAVMVVLPTIMVVEDVVPVLQERQEQLSCLAEEARK